MTEPDDDSPPTSTALATSESVLERHRALARVTNERVQRLYSWGGAFAAALAGAPVVVALALRQLVGPLPWVLAALCGVVGLGIVRGRIRNHLAEIRAELDAYCQVNALSLEAMLRYYAGRGDYPFFSSLERRLAPESDPGSARS